MDESASKRRQIAYKIRIRDILNGRYVKEEGWNPNFIVTSDGRQISRANIIGIVVSAQEDQDIGYSLIAIDDGTGNISVRSFGEDAGMLKGLQIGDIVLIIGRPREYNSELYLLSEIVKKIDNKRWIELRKLEICPEAEDSSHQTVGSTAIGEKAEGPVEESVVEEENVGAHEDSTHDKIIDYIRNLDKGDGVDFEEVLKEFKDEKSINSLLSEGELFEIRPGRIKVLE